MKGDLPRPIRIVYKRLPNNVREIPGLLREATLQQLVIESPIVVPHPMRLSGKVVADNGYLAIWFVYRDRWYDVGRFFDRSRNFVGYYCDIVKPMKQLLMGPSKTAMITDLFLDLWIWPDGQHTVLDEDEFKHGLQRRHISRLLALEAQKQLALLVRRVNSKRFPPAYVRKTKPLEPNL